MDGDEPISHGICADCRDSFLQHNGVSLQAFIDKFSFPVLVLNGSLEPVSLNKVAAASTRINLEEIQHFSMGEIVECKHSHSPEGCGRTVHCTGCVLRNSVRETNETGQPFSAVPAKLNTTTTEIQLYVSTMRVDGTVFVKLEKP